MVNIEINKILITGGSGFIGQNLQEYLISLNYEVVNLDLVSPVEKGLVSYWKKCNICDLVSLKKHVLDFSPHYIIHLAARTDLDGSTIDDYSANTIGVENLMNIISFIQNLKKVIVTSSMLVCCAGYYPKDQFDYCPTTWYGKSKVETEKKVWEHKPKCDWAIIRPTSIWGPWFGTPYKNFFDMILSRRYFHIGKKGGTKTYGYVGNAVYQIEQILLNNTYDENNKVFYIGDFPATNIEEWANEIASELNYKIYRVPFFFIRALSYVGDVLTYIGAKFPMYSFRLKNMTTDNIVDLSNINEIAKNMPFTRIEGIRKTLEWMRSAKR